MQPGFSETSAFLAVIEQRSFTRAAKQLGLSPPRVSELVRNLEERLGVRLVERTTRSVAPTAAGERLHERLRPVLDDYRAALETTNAFRDKPAGLLRLTVAPPAADAVLKPAIPGFLAAYPEISLDISVESSRVDIVAGRFDAGIRPGGLVARDMVAVRVSDDFPRPVVAAPSYLKRRGKPAAPHELAAHDCIRLGQPDGGTMPWRFRAKGRTLEVQVEGRLIASDIGMAIKAAVDGVGLLQLPYGSLAPELNAGRLVAVLGDWTPPTDGFFAYYPSRRQIRPPLKALLDYLRKARRSS